MQIPLAAFIFVALMKKIVVAISLMLYLGVSTGIVVNFHYCMDRLASTQIFGHEAKVCGQCGMHMDEAMGCCRDEVKVVKMDDDQRVTFADMLVIQAPAILPIDYSNYFYEFLPESIHKGSLKNHSPPLLSEQDTYLQNRVFRL